MAPGIAGTALAAFILQGTLTLMDAERMALERNPDYQATAREADIALADQRAQRGLLLPRLHLDATLLYWNSPFVIAPTAAGTTPLGTAPLVPVRAQTTSTLALTLTQPLTALWGLLREYDARKLLRAASLAHLDGAGRDLLLQVRTAYFRSLQAERNALIAEESVVELRAHLEVARQQLLAQTAVEADLLRAQVQLGQAEQDLSRASANRAQARAALSVQLGADPSAPSDVADPFEGRALPQVTQRLEELTAQALATRPGLREARLRRDAADAEVSATWSQLVPALSVQGTYQHTTGELFFPRNQASIGGVLSWDAWDWGYRYELAKGAQARSAQALANVRSYELRLRADVERAREDLNANRTALALSEQVVVQAQEAFRQQTERYRAGTATTVELLDAQTALLQSKLRFSNARFDYLITVAQLENLVGEPLLWR